MAYFTKSDPKVNCAYSYKANLINGDLCIIISPEGTRKKVEKFKTGYYYIAKGANIPIFRCKFDYFQKIVSFDVPFFVGNDAAEDLKVIEDYFRGTPGKIPALSF